MTASSLGALETLKRRLPGIKDGFPSGFALRISTLPHFRRKSPVCLPSTGV